LEGEIVAQSTPNLQSGIKKNPDAIKAKIDNVFVENSKQQIQRTADGKQSMAFVHFEI